jgi:hypothetical protein
MREKTVAAMNRDIWPTTSRQSRTDALSFNMSQCRWTCCHVWRWLRMCARSR